MTSTRIGAWLLVVASCLTRDLTAQTAAPVGANASFYFHPAAPLHGCGAILGCDPRFEPPEQQGPSATSAQLTSGQSRALYISVGALTGALVAGGIVVSQIARCSDDCMVGPAMPVLAVATAGGAVVGGLLGWIIHDSTHGEP